MSTLAATNLKHESAIGNNIVLDSSGKVGVGTASPAVAMDVVGQVRASTGILFGSDTAAANALDDYEEGTWTPGLGGASYSSGTRYGYYRKIGDLVVANCVFDSATVTSGSSARITGLPFTASVGTGETRFPGFNSHTTGSSISTQIQGGYARQGETAFQLIAENSSSTVSLGNGSFSIFLTIIYIA